MQGILGICKMCIFAELLALNKVGNEIARSEGKFVVVGTPCHIQGLLLVQTVTSGDWLAPTIGMFGFALALALPLSIILNEGQLLHLAAICQL